MIDVGGNPSCWSQPLILKKLTNFQTLGRVCHKQDLIPDNRDLIPDNRDISIDFSMESSLLGKIDVLPATPNTGPHRSTKAVSQQHLTF